MSKRSIWIQGQTRSGKTQRLSQYFQDWAKNQRPNSHFLPRSLILAANGNNRRQLGDRLLQTVSGNYPVQCQTLLGFMEAEIWLFWPLLMTQIPHLAPFPLKLRPETEQIWALALWRQEILGAETESISATATARLVRDSLDLMQLAGAAGIELETIAERLEQGWPDYQSTGCSPAQRGQFLQAWQAWCWQRGFLTYGLIYELYWRYLLPQTDYRVRLNQRFSTIFADDLDDYPGIALELFECLLDGGAWGVFTFSPDGKMRLGLNADSDYLQTLARRCLVEKLDHASGLAALTGNTILAILGDRFSTAQLPENIQVIQTIARSKLLQDTAHLIINAVKTGEVKPEEVVIIAPGLDEIARYTLIQLLTEADIPVEALNEQRPLYSEALIRSLLTLLALIFPGLGSFALRDDVAEMLVIISQTPQFNEQSQQKLVPIIDPVRAGILADICYQLNPENPQLLPIETFARWDRLGYLATQKYQFICQWITKTKNELIKLPSPTPLEILHRAIAELLPDQQYLTYAQLAALRELMETAQHFWEVEEKLGEQSLEFRHENSDFNLNKITPNAQKLSPHSIRLSHFLHLLKLGTISANPLPLAAWGQNSQRVILATIFQYRSLRSQHRWHFWLDAGSSLWSQGGASQLFAAPLFQQHWSGEMWDTEAQLQLDQARMERIIRDLLGRVEEKLYLCHSDLNVRGVEQIGPLLNLIQAAS